VQALPDRGPYMTSIVGEIEMVRVCRRANVPAEQVEELREWFVAVALDNEVRRLAFAVAPVALRTLDAIHVATALSLRPELHELVTYDSRLADAADRAGFAVLAPR
jgi:uncharacterized protein